MKLNVVAFPQNDTRVAIVNENRQRNLIPLSNFPVGDNNFLFFPHIVWVTITLIRYYFHTQNKWKVKQRRKNQDVNCREILRWKIFRKKCWTVHLGALIQSDPPRRRHLPSFSFSHGNGVHPLLIHTMHKSVPWAISSSHGKGNHGVVNRPVKRSTLEDHQTLQKSNVHCSLENNLMDLS